MSSLQLQLHQAKLHQTLDETVWSEANRSIGLKQVIAYKLVYNTGVWSHNDWLTKMLGYPILTVQ
jgi:hypothetical protein